MVRRESLSKRCALLGILSMSIVAYAAMLHAASPVQALTTYTGKVKPMEFYFHHLDTPVSVAGIQTKYVMNSTKWFKFQTQQEAFANSFYKEIGLSKVAIDFYIYPNLAGQVTVNGTWQVFVWVNGSAYKPVTFTLQFKEVTLGGVTQWDSGQLSPTVASSVGEYIDVPVYSYNLSAPLDHVFNVGTTVHVHVEINAGASADTRIWYDSPLYPSKIILPLQDYARPVSVKSYDVNGAATDMFYYNWSAGRRKVVVRVNVTDPLGGYDINRVNMTILDPSGSPVVEDIDMLRVSNGLWRVGYMHVYEANWSYPMTAQLGNYTIQVSVVDYNGYYQNLNVGTFEPHIELATHMFSMGVMVLYSPSFQVVDDVGDPLPKAQVHIASPNGTTNTLPLYTSEKGFINLTQVLPGSYGFTILWKDEVVKQTSLLVDSDGPYTIECNVYQLTVQVVGNNGMSIHGAYVIVYTQAGVGYGLETTDPTGRAVFKLPPGTYQIDVRFNTDYWLTMIRASATETSVPVEASMSKTMTLAEFPPVLWTTTGFLLVIAAVIAALLSFIYIVYKTYIRYPAHLGR